MNNIHTVPILGIPIYADSLNAAVDLVINHSLSNDEKRNLRVSATGAHGLVIAKKDNEFSGVLKTCFVNLPDGMPGVWIGKLKGKKKMERCYGPDFFKAIMKATARHPIKHFFCGGKTGVPEELAAVCGSMMNNKNIVGTFSPPFRPMIDQEMLDLGQRINTTAADILWIGLSTPKQELFAARLAEFVSVKFIITIGAAFDFFTGKVVQAPRFIQRSGLEWFFRLCIEPRRLYKRYFTVIPLFIAFNIAEIIHSSRKRHKGDL
jgi:N-acetylglucosaminyldiphosphoundecaprenol N-acetyl-beta-D-mannosaminyltransferase